MFQPTGLAPRIWWLVLPWVALWLWLGRLALGSLALRSISGVYILWAVASLPLWALSCIVLTALKSKRLRGLWVWGSLEVAASMVALAQSRMLSVSGGVLRGSEGWLTLVLLAATPALVTAAMVHRLIASDTKGSEAAVARM